MADIDQNVLSKIRKLLARADESRNDNPHEREIAMRQANALMAKHGLEMSQVAGEATQDNAFGSLGETTAIYRGSPWRSVVYGQMARLHGCECLKYKRRGTKETCIYVIGRELRAAVALSLAEYLINSIVREALVTWKAAGGELSGTGISAWRTEFGKGAATSIFHQVTRILEEQKKGVIPESGISTSNALVVASQYEKALVEAKDFMYQRHRVGKARSYTTKGGAANQQGREFGSRLSLNAQLGGGAASKRIGRE